MKLIIDVPEEVYKGVTSNPRGMLDKHALKILSAFYDATPIPKIDLDWLIALSKADKE